MNKLFAGLKEDNERLAQEIKGMTKENQSLKEHVDNQKMVVQQQSGIIKGLQSVLENTLNKKSGGEAQPDKVLEETRPSERGVLAEPSNSELFKNSSLVQRSEMGQNDGANAFTRSYDPNLITEDDKIVPDQPVANGFQQPNFTSQSNRFEDTGTFLNVNAKMERDSNKNL